MATRFLVCSTAIVVMCSTLRADVIGFATDSATTSPSSSVQWTAGQDGGSSKLTISDSGTGSSSDASGNILLDHLGDPTIDVENIVYNHSGSDWTGYQAAIVMNQSFSILSPFINQPLDWNYSVTQPTYDATLGEYIGFVGLNGGTPIQSLSDKEPADELDFGYTMSFGGTQPPTFGQTLTSVPEPSSVTMLVLFALASIPALRSRTRLSHR